MFKLGKKDVGKQLVIKKTIPPLILNKDWHNLFPNQKPSAIRNIEKKQEQLLKNYSQLKQDVKDYDRLKKQVMGAIIADMDNISNQTPDKVDKKMDTNSNLIHDLNQRIADAEDRLLDLPGQIDACNQDLIVQTGNLFYQKLVANTDDYYKVKSEIEDLKGRLRKLLDQKVDLEEENDHLYHHLHQVLGAEIIDQLDEHFMGQQANLKAYRLKDPADGDGNFLAAASREEKKDKL